MQASTDRAKEIFLHALELAGEEARSAYLETVCGTDAELRKRVENLLRSHRPEDSFLDPRKLHGNTPSGYTQTSDFADTSTSPRARQSKGSINELKPWLTASTQPNSLGRFLHYELLEELGQGGFGIVYRVFDEKLHRVVALKILSPALASNSAARQRFLREARAAAAVRHEHVISIHAVDDEPLPHLVMEFISGQTLQQKIDKVSTLRLKEILRIGMQMAQGLEAAHKQGLIHRDIKPSNILLENGIERVKISDFGLARAVDDTSISHQGMILGTPSFMSPEQADGKPVDARSDLFSLGSTLYAMCTGQSPFQGSSTIAVLKMVVEATPSPITMLNQELPGWLDEIVSKLLAKNPQDRFASASEVAALLQSRLADIQLHQAQPVQSTKQPVKQDASGTRPVILTLAFMIVAAIIVYYAYEMYPEDAPAIPPAQPATTQPPGTPDVSVRKVNDEPRLFKRYNPKVDRPTLTEAKLSVTENDTVWNWENNTKDRGFTVAFDPILQNLPTEGVIICKLKIRMTKHHKDSWGDLLLDTFGPSHFGYEWPVLKYRFTEETTDFIEREVRYPAHVFYQKSPPQLMVQIGLYGPGILEVKELELWHIPGKPVKPSGKSEELKALVESARRNLDDAQKQYNSGIIPHDDVLKAEVKWLEARVNLAEDRHNYLEVIDYLSKIQNALEVQLSLGKKRVEAGVIREAALFTINEAIIKNNARLTQAKAANTRER